MDDTSLNLPSELARQSDDDRDPLKANVVGTLAHDVLEQFDYRDCSDAAIMRSVQQFGESEAMNSAVFPRVKAVVEYLKDDVLGAEDVIRELPFVAAFRSDQDGGRIASVFVDGKIDLLYRKNERWHIVDYKFTESGESKIRSEYAFQLQLYASALASGSTQGELAFGDGDTCALLLLGCNKAATLTPVVVEPLSEEATVATAIHNASIIAGQLS